MDNRPKSGTLSRVREPAGRRRKRTPRPHNRQMTAGSKALGSSWRSASGGTIDSLRSSSWVSNCSTGKKAMPNLNCTTGSPRNRKHRRKWIPVPIRKPHISRGGEIRSRRHDQVIAFLRRQEKSRSGSRNQFRHAFRGTTDGKGKQGPTPLPVAQDTLLPGKPVGAVAVRWGRPLYLTDSQKPAHPPLETL